MATLVLSVVGGSAAIGCAGERDPINRVQPGAYDKSFFLGEDLQDYKDDPEYRTKSFQIDSPANTGGFGSTIGLSGAVDRIRWEVTEGMLFARRSYQEAPGADNKALPKVRDKDGREVWQGPANGSIIAAFRIQSHFDIRRDYNPGTGEEGNVIVENSSDRPWYQRQFMRVDWSQNLAKSTSGDTMWVFGEGANASPIQYAVTNELDEDYPKFDPEAGYIDVTAKYQVDPEMVPSWGVPECVIVGFFNGTASWDCTPTEVKVRHSFVRLTGKEDFEPFEESLAQRDIVGNWGNAGNNFNREYGAPPISTYDPQYGFTDANTKTFYAHHNIWEQSHQDKACGSNADDNNDGTADACENSVTQYQKSTGSQCDTIIGKCTIPVRDRKVKPIRWWLNQDAPVDLLDETDKDAKTITRPGAIEQTYVTWNQLLKVAVATRREVECRRTLEGTRDECHALYFEGIGPAAKEMVAFGGWGIDKVVPQEADKDEKGQDIKLVDVCHNPVRGYDNPACGKPGEVIRLGDIRKNYGIYWPYWSRAGYGGVATIGADPLTGEMLGVSATTMMRSVTFAAAQVRDILQLALGDVKVEELIEGSQQSRFADLVRNGKVATEFGAQPKTAAQLAEIPKNLDLPALQAAVGQDGAKVRNAPRKFAKIEKAKQDRLLSPTGSAIAKANQQVEALASKVAKTEFKTSMANRNLLQMQAQLGDPNSPVARVISTMASQDPTKVQELMDSYHAWLGNRGICFMDSMNLAGAGSIYLPSLAPYFKKLYGNLDPKTRGVKVYQDLQREIVNGIAFHEVGHAIGMRHNFSSSWDSQNYAPQYWQLRTGEKKITDVEQCTGPRSGGSDTCMGPRYIDPPSEDELGQLPNEPRPGIEYFANTSTMEYQIERFGETVGAGTYDLHFMKTIYGRVLETLDDRQINPDDQPFFAVKTLSQGINDELVYDQDKGFGVHYTRAARLAKVFDPARDCRPATEEEKETAKWRIVHGKVCAPPPKNHLAYHDMKTSEIAFKLSGSLTPVGVDGIRWLGKDYGSKGKSLVRWHYRYGEDYSRGGYLHAKLFDSGADIYEITSNVIKRFDLTYPWSYFRRQNKEFAWWSVPTSVWNNTFSRIRGYHWNTATNIGRAAADDLNDDDKERPSVIANQEMWDFLQRAVTMVEPGAYGAGADTTRRTPKRAGAITIYDIMSDGEASQPGKLPAANVGIVDGRFIQVDFDNRKGGSWDYNSFPVHVGYDQEKVLALIELTDSRPTLSTVSRDNALDDRGVRINFRTDTPHAVDRLLGGILAEDWETFAPSADAEGKITPFSLTPSDSTKLTRPANAKVLFPNLGYENQVSALIYAYLFSRSDSDMTLVNKMRVRFDNDNGPSISDDKKVQFTDPATGYRYVATKFGTETIQGRAVETGIGSRMLQRANEILAQTYQTTGVPNAFGEPTLVLSNGKPVPTGDTLQLRRYVGLLDAARQIGNILGGGPLGGGGGGGDD